MKFQQSKGTTPLVLITVFFLLVIGILVAGFFFYQAQQRQIKKEAQNNLAAIADLKVDQITQWRSERIRNAEVINDDVFFAMQVETYFKNPTGAVLKRELLSSMRTFQNHFQYESVLLINTKGVVHLAISVHGDTIGTHAHALVKEAFIQRKVIFSDLHSADFSTVVHMDLAIPLISVKQKDSIVVGALLLRIDPNQVLFPVIQKWPTPSRSSETLLIEREGDEIVYLNELRHHQNTIRSFHLPMSQQELPASMALRGIEGIVEGKDYRGVPVLAAIRKIHNTPWFMIAKVDQDEIFAPLQLQAWIVGLGVFLLILSTGAVIGFWWRHQRARFYREQYESHIERQALVKHFEYLIKYANDIIFLFDMEGKIFEANDQACRSYGYTQEEMHRLRMQDILVSGSSSDIEKQIKQQGELGRGQLFETEHRRKDGTKFPVEISSQFIRIENNKYMQCIIRDITERKRAEETLRESEAKLQEAQQIAGIGHYILDVPTGMWSCSKMLDVLFGIDKNFIKDIAGWEKIIHPEDRQELSLYLMDHVIKEKNPFDREYRIIRVSDGAVRWLHGLGNLEFDILGQPLKMFGIIQDITEKKQAEDRLREGEDRFRRIFEEGPLGMATSGADFKFMKVNAAFCKLMGYEAHELTSMTFKEITHPDHLTEDVDSIKKLSAGEIPIYRTEKRYVRKDKRVVWGAATITVVRDTNKQFLYFIAMIEDITERRHAEEALRESEERYRELYENASIGIYRTTPDGNILLANPRLIDMLGSSSLDEVKAHNLERARFEPSFQRIDFKQIMEQDGEVRGLESVWRRQDGSTIFVRENAKAVLGPDNSILYFDGIAEDITDHKQAEESLRKSEELFKMLVESSPVAIAVFSGETKDIEYVSHRFTELFGYEQQDIPSLDSWWSLAYPINKYRNQIESIWNNSVEQAQLDANDIEPLESVITCKDGSNKYIESTFSSMGELTLVFFSDLTQRRMAEEALRQTHAFNDLLIQTMPFGMNIVDEHGHILFISKTMKEMLKNDVIDQCCWNVYKDNNEQCQDCPLKRGISFGKPDVIETTGIFGGKTFQISHVGMMYEGRKAMLEVFQDITEKKKLQQELIQSQKMLSIGTLAGGIAHDFNNILGIILGYISILPLTKDNPQKFSDGMSAIKQAVDRGAGLVKQILTFASKTDVAFEPTNVPDLARELVSMLQQTFPKTITFAQEIEPQLPVINADHTQIHQILLNLCVNARDAMAEGGVITIRANIADGFKLLERFPTATEQQYLCISVSDTGTGMDDTIRDRIFDPFFTTKEKGKGTGLGLSVVYGVVQAHHGFVDVESTVGNGTTFRLYLPVQKENFAAIETGKVKEHVAGGTETLLVVEDEELMLNMLQILLEEHGYTVLTAQDGAEAVNVYSQHTDEIALVLTDMGLPKLSGEGEFRKLKELNPEVKIILASGYFEPHVKAALERAGALGFLQKPYIIEDVLARIRNVLD